MIEINVKQLPSYFPSLAAFLVTFIAFIILEILHNFLLSYDISLFFGWTFVLSIVIFVMIYLSLRKMLKSSQVRAYTDIVLMVTPLLNDPSLSNSKLQKNAEKLDIAFQGLEHWIKLSEDEYLQWIEVKEILNKKEEVLELAEKCLYINPMNEYAFWKLIYYLRSQHKEVKAIKYLDIFSVIKDPGVKNLWKALVYEPRYPNEAKIFYDQSINEGINTESLNLKELDGYLKDLIGSFEDPEILMKHKGIFSRNLGEYWDLLTKVFPDTTILEKYYILTKIMENYETKWLGDGQRFT
ncbi:MAG: hypothetical protein JSW11_16165 [Candidatus Heimdallarchaeota archaeon]|nr:MAG: hypothetical protein JSW11_16165 [Candidatus Heimdallarchaeota archaeon]